MLNVCCIQLIVQQVSNLQVCNCKILKTLAMTLHLWMMLHLMPVSHRAYGLYSQTCTVNAYGHPKIYPTYGLHGQLARSLHSRTVALTACTVARMVSTVGRTVYTVSCYGQPERYK